MTDANEVKQSKDNADKKALKETATDKSDAGQTTDVKPEKQSKSGRGFFLFLLLLVAAAAAALGVYNYKSMEEFNSLLSESSSAESSMKGVVAGLEHQVMPRSVTSWIC